MALHSNENEMDQAAGHIDRIHLDHYSAGVYAPDAAGTLGTEPPKGGPKNPSHDISPSPKFAVDGICICNLLRQAQQTHKKQRTGGGDETGGSGKHERN